MSITAVLVLTALGVLCTRRCFREDFPAAEGPLKMHCVTSTDTEPYSRDCRYTGSQSNSKRSSAIVELVLKMV